MSTSNPTTKIARSPLLAIFIALVFLLGGLPGPGQLVEPAAAQATTGLRIVAEDYATDVTTIFGIQAYAYVVLTNAADDKTEQRDLVENVNVTTPNNPILEIDLLETGPETGVFIGGFGFDATGNVVATLDPIYGRLGIGAPAKIKVPADASVVVTVKSASHQDTVTWKPSADIDVRITDSAGTSITAGRALPILGTQGSISFRVADADLNQNANTADVWNNVVHVTSDSDPVGRAVTLTETADAGVFTGSIGLRTSTSDQANTIFVRHGDNITASVVDHRNGAGDRVLHRYPTSGAWTFNMASTGQILFDNPTYVGNTVGSAQNGLDRAVLTVIDVDPNRNALLNTIDPSQDNRVTIAVNGAPISTPVTLTEIPGAGVGIATPFIAVLGFNCGAGVPDHVTCIANVPNGATISATYTDVPTASGAASSKTTTASWRQAETAKVTLGSSDTQDRLFGTTAPVTVQVEDADANRNAATRDSLTVRVKSTSSPMGMDLALTETTANSGLFTGTLQFATTATSGRLLVADRDQVLVHYDDPANDDGKAERIPSNKGSFVVWRTDTVATVTMAETNHYLHKDDSISTTAHLNKADVFVSDQDQNNPFVRDSITATAVRLTGTTTTSTITLRETGIDTGLFHGYVTFGRTAGGGNIFVEQDTTAFTVEYTDVIVPGGNSRTTSAATATAWRAVDQDSNAVLRFEQSRNGHPERVNTFYLDATSVAGSNRPAAPIMIVVYAPPGSGNLLAKLESTQCTESAAVGEANQHREVQLREDAATPGRYSRMFNITVHAGGNLCEPTPPSNSNFLSVPLGTSFTTRVVLPTSGSPLQATTPVRERLVETARFVGADLTTDIDRVAGLNQVTGIRIERWNHNMDSARREVLDQQVQGRGGAVATTVRLVETGPDTGVFVGSFVYSTTGADSMLQKVHVKDVKRLKLPGATFNTVEPANYNMFSGATFVTSTNATDAVSWWPAPDAAVTIISTAFANSPFSVRIEDGDGLANRRFDMVDTTTGVSSYTFGSGPHVVGSELVMLSRTNSTVQSAAAPTYKETLGPGPVGHTAAEGVADRNFDGVIDCQDVVMTGTRTQGGLSGSSTPLGSDQVRCLGVAKGAGGAWEVTYAFTNRFAKATCTPTSAPLAPVTCTGTVKSWYRPMQVSTCATSQSAQIFEYQRNGATMRLCDAPPAGSSLVMTYLLSQRELTVRSINAEGGSLETETIPATYSTNDAGAADTRWFFTASVPVQATADSDDDTIHVAGTRTTVDFAYRDAARAFDSQPGSAEPNHLRAVRASDTWRAATTAIVKIMDPGFSAEATAPVFGPAIPVEIVDADSDVSPSIDVITATIETPGSGLQSFQLRETGGTTGVFRGIATAPAGTPLTVRYSDPAGTSGTPTTASKSLATKTALLAEIEMGTSGNLTGSGPTRGLADRATSTAVINGNQGHLFVLVRDPDANQATTAFDKIQIRVRSDSEPDGPVIELTEIGADEGVFLSGPIQFEATRLAGNNRLFANDTVDRVWAEYDDQNDGAGNRRLVRPSDTAATGGNDAFTHWNRHFDGIVRFEQTFYKDETTGVTCRPIISCAHLTVADGDWNANPRLVETIDAPASLLTVGKVNAEGTFNPASPGPVFTKLVETGANTGVFIGYAAFADGAGTNTPAGASTLGRIATANTGTVMARYDDPASAAGPPETFQDTTQWFSKNHGVVAFDKRGYGDPALPVKLRLYDGNVNPEPSTVVVKVTSDATPAGIDVTLTKPTSPVRPGFWQGSFNIRDTAGSGTGLLVNDEDTLTVSYTDSSPAGTRVSTAVVAIGDELAPVTSLTTNPATPDGENGWFRTAPTVTLTPDETVDSTRYRLNGGAEREYLPGNPIVITTEGIHTIEFWSIDFAPNTEEPQTVEVKFDATAPTSSVTGLTARSAPRGAIDLSWQAVSGKTDPLQFGSYKVYQGTTSNYVGNATSESFSHTPASDGTHTYLVAVADAAGNVDVSNAVSVSGISDRVAPRMASASVSPTELFEELDLDLTVTITGTVNEADLSDVDRVEANVLNPFDEGITNVTMTRQGTTNVWRGTFADFPGISGNYTFKIAALDKAGNAAPENRTVRFHAIDREPPRVTVPETVVQGTPLAVAVKDNDKGIATISYRLNGAAAVNVPVTGGPLDFTFTIPTGALALGTHSLSVSVADLNGTANFATYPLSFTVTDSDGTAPPPTGGAPVVQLANKFVENGGRLKLRVGSPTPLTALTVAFDGGAAQAVLSSWQSSGVTEVSVGSLAPGKHTARVVATNTLGSVTQDLQIYVLDPGIPLPPTNVEVTRGPDGFPLITWTASESTNVGGYLVHRASSPYKVIKVVEADTLEHADRTAEPGTTYMYAVTAFSTDGTGRLDEGVESETQMPWLLEIEGSSFTVEDDKSNFWTVFWVILILLVVVSAVVLLVVYRERIFRPRGESGEIYDDDYPDGSGTTTLPFGEQQHDLRCPNCTTEFSVTGEKPIVTTCPNCGKKGILR